MLIRTAQAGQCLELIPECRGIIIGGDCIEVVMERVGDEAVEFVTQTLPQGQDQADCEDAHEECQHGRSRASTRAAYIAQGYLYVGLPGLWQCRDAKAEHCKDKEQTANGRQNQQHDNREHNAHYNERKITPAKTLRHWQLTDEENHRVKGKAQKS